MKTSRRTLLKATAGSLALYAMPAFSATPLKIGFAMSLTGPNAGAGKMFLLAREVWRDDINAKGGLLGRPVEFVYYDDQTTIVRADEDALTQTIIALASQYGRYGYRRIKSLLDEAGWDVGCDRVQRIWRREGLKVPQKQRPRGRLWLNDGSCIRLRPERRNHVWSYDFVEAQTHDGRKLRLMMLIDEFTRECLAIRVARRINSFGVLETMADVMLTRGVPEHIRSDNGAEMRASVVCNWLAQVGAKTLFIEPGSPWENGYCELFNGNAMSCSMEKSSTA